MRKYRFLFIIVYPIVLVDQASKIFVTHTLYLNQSIEVIPGLLNIVYIMNPGAAFGILRENNSFLNIPIFLVISIIAIGVIFYLYMREEEYFSLRGVGLSLLMAGTFGNLIDRIRLGGVVDFIDFYLKSFHWPAFNLADIAITSGAFLLILSLKFQVRSSQS